MHLKSSLLTVVGPLVSANLLGWSKEEFTKNLPFGSPTLATGGYDATKHVGGSHGFFIIAWFCIVCLIKIGERLSFIFTNTFFPGLY